MSRGAAMNFLRRVLDAFLTVNAGNISNCLLASLIKSGVAQSRAVFLFPLRRVRRMSEQC